MLRILLRGTMGKRTNQVLFFVATLAAASATACSAAGTGEAAGGGSIDAGSGDPCAVNPMCATRAITTGNAFSCALSGGGRVKCWGYNVFGNLGLSDTITRGDNAGEMGANLPAVDLGAGRTVISVAAG